MNWYLEEMYVEVDESEAMVTATYRIVRETECCSAEVKEAKVELIGEVDMSEPNSCQCSGDDRTWSAELEDAEIEETKQGFQVTVRGVVICPSCTSQMSVSFDEYTVEEVT
jgi:hypothetical protein